MEFPSSTDLKNKGRSFLSHLLMCMQFLTYPTGGRLEQACVVGPEENQCFTCSLSMTTRWLEVLQGFGSCCLGSELSFLTRWLLWQFSNLHRSGRSTFWESEQCISRTSSILYNQENRVLAWCCSTHFESQHLGGWDWRIMRSMPAGLYSEALSQTNEK